MRVLNFALAAALCSGVFLFAGNASAGSPSSDIFDGFWDIEDSQDPNSNTCYLEMNDNFLDSGGSVTGLGTGGEVVRIDYQAIEPTDTNRDTKQGRVRQSRFSLLNILFDGVSATGDIFPQKCAVDVKVNEPKLDGHGVVDCRGGDLNLLLSADEVASIQTAFADIPRVKFKANANKQTWSLAIKCFGDALLD